MKPDDPRQVLGLGPEAGDQQIRAAYLEKVKQFPPDRFPREFERVRAAYEVLHDPRERSRHMIVSADPFQPLESLLEGVSPVRKFLGPEPWLAVLRDLGK